MTKTFAFLVILILTSVCTLKLTSNKKKAHTSQQVVTASQLAASASGPIFMPITDNPFIVNGNLEVTGLIFSGTITNGQQVDIISMTSTVRTTVNGISLYAKNVASAKAGDTVALLLRGVTTSQVKNGFYVVSVGTLPVGKIGCTLTFIKDITIDDNFHPLFSSFNNQSNGYSLLLKMGLLVLQMVK